ncbi:MAG TPA: FAD-dependent oxidoreductase [Tepidisphaeraceae bacterium]|jgi:hypothetical protein|nr:FAD-dependent oxidoreductase [Tepidisphaeraceae bacterium]
MNDLHEIETDLLVAGGGMAGVCAAIAAARQGVRVVLVQDRSVLGGNASSEIRMHIVGADNHGGRKGWRESGIIEELRLEDAVRNPERSFPLWDAILYEKVIAEPNITLLLDSDVVGVEMAFGGLDPAKLPARTDRMYEFNGVPGRIAAARVVRNITQDEFVIRAKQFADCTGDGRLGFEAGADFRIGRESKAMHGESLAVDVDDVHTLGSSMLLTTRNVGHPVPFTPPPWARKFDPEQLKVGRHFRSWEYGFWWIEWGGTLNTIKDNCTTIRHELYRIALGLWDYVKNSGLFPDSANWALDWVGAVPGKRESRRFMGPHVLTQQDVLEARQHPDVVAYGGWAIDLHPVRGIDAVDEPPFTPTHTPTVYGIPLRCYFSRNIENLFFAGRDISATHVGFASTRVMATCAIGGEAVGFAAAQCVKEQVTPAQLVADAQRLRRLQQTMLRHDVTLLNTKVDPAGNHVMSAEITASSTAAPSAVENIRNGQTRDEVAPKTAELLRSHGWRSAALTAGTPQWIEVRWPQPVEIRELHLWFDSGFTRELILSPSNGTTSHCIRGPQPELVKDYTIEVNGDKAVTVAGNHERKRVHRFEKPVVVRSLRLNVTATQGAEEARVFEIRAY